MVNFLDYRISAVGVEPLLKRGHGLGLPETLRHAVSSILLMVGEFLQGVHPGDTKILSPLTDALLGSGKVKLQWTAGMESTFQQAKQAVCNATSLAHQDPPASLCLAETRQTHMGGGVLQQQTAHRLQPLVFFSAKLLAAYLVVRHFRFLLEAKGFHILTDHKPLTFTAHWASEPWTARQQWQLSYLMEFTADIRHLASKDNVVADALLRPSQPNLSSSLVPLQAVAGLFQAETCHRQLLIRIRLLPLARHTFPGGR
jgi:cytoskeleton-associated protein 5